MNESENTAKAGRKVKKEFQVTRQEVLKAKTRAREVVGMEIGWL